MSHYFQKLFVIKIKKSCIKLLTTTVAFKQHLIFFIFQESDCAVPSKYGDRIVESRIGLEHVKSVLADVRDGSMVLVCGTRSFIKDMLNYLQECGVSNSSVHTF